MKKRFLISALTMTALSAPTMLHATDYTWTGTASTAWNNSSNWGNSGPPNAYTDTATISSATNNPVSLSTLVNLGATSGNALTIGTGASGSFTDLDITSLGKLGMQGNILINAATSGTTKNRGITIEGTLENDSATNTFYSIAGSTASGHGTETVTLNGGTITSLNGGGWNFTAPVTVGGFGTISAPFTGIVTATSTNQALNITSYNSSPMAIASPTLNFSSTTGYYNLSDLILSGVTLSGTSGRSQFTNSLPGTYSNNWGNTPYGLLNVTGDTLIDGAIISSGGSKVFNITNSTLTLNNPGTIPGSGNTNTPPAFVLGTGGNLNITGNNDVSLPSSSASIPINGGALTYTGTGHFNAYSFIGNGSISGVSNLGAGNVNANGGTLAFNANNTYGVTLGIASGAGASLNSSVGSTLALKGSFNFIQPGTIAPNGGTVNLDGVTLASTVTPWVVTLGSGAVNVTNDSTFTSVAGSSFTSNANLTINSGKTLNASGATFTNYGTVTNNGGTATWGNFTNNGVYKSDPSTQTFNNLTVGSTGYLTGTAGDVYNITGNFTNNSTQNNTWDTSQAALAFTAGTSQTFALAGKDVGQSSAGLANNFAWNSLTITGSLNLSDGNAANSGTALYVEQIFGANIDGTTVTNITGNNYNIYYDPNMSSNSYLNDQTYSLQNGGVLAPDVAPVPIPGSAWLLGSGLMGLIGFSRKKSRS